LARPGRAACYTYDFADRQSALNRAVPPATCASGATAVVSSTTYYPSGPLAGAVLANGVTETRSFDKRYFPSSIAASGPAGFTATYSTDKVGNPLQITEASGNRTYAYQDFQYFLTSGWV